MRNVKKGGRKSISKRDKSRLYEQSGGKCFYCGEKIELFHAIGEHKIPSSRGGRNHIDNFVISCWVCDRMKGSMTADEFFYFKENSKSEYERRRKLVQKVDKVVKTQRRIDEISGAFRSIKNRDRFRRRIRTTRISAREEEAERVYSNWKGYPHI